MAEGRMTRPQIVGELAQRCGISRKQVKCLLENIAVLACREAKNGFTLPGLGRLALVNRQAREGRNPATGERIQIPARQWVKFRVSRSAKETILGRPQ